ncbi:MAG TPA: MFS transporter [Burkholderiaceae bacterium]|nr:MFS transporter [Burkholderiaceae bacterium]
MNPTTAARMSASELRASLALASIFGLRMLGLFLVLPVLAVHARGLPGGDDALRVGLALGIYGLTQALLQIPYGVASDRWGRKPLIVFGLVVFAVGSVVAALATDLDWMIAGRALQGLGAISAAVTALIADLTREEHRTKAMAMVGASIGLAFALSLISAPPLYGVIGMSGLFGLTAVLALAAIAVVLWVVPAAPRVAPGNAPGGGVSEHGGAARGWAIVLRAPELRRLNAGIFVLHAVQMAMFVVVPGLLVQHGLPLPQHGWVYLAAVLGSFVLMMPVLLAAERRGRVRQLLLASIALMLSVQLGLAVWAPGVAALAFWLLLFFVAFNILEASLPSLTSRLAPPAHKGLALGVYNTTQALGLFVGGAAGGWFARYAGAPAVFTFTAVALLVWLVIAAGMREPPRRARRPEEALAAEAEGV